MRRRSVVALFVAIVIAASTTTCSKSGKAPTAPEPPICSVSPSSLNFGTVAAGQSTIRNFTVRNTGGGTLSGSISVGAGPFSLIGSSNYSLGAGQSVTEAVQYTWQQAGTASTTIATGSSGCTGVSCSAVGASSPCVAAPTTLAFGHVRVGDSRDLSFSVTNSSSTTFIATARETCADFSFVGASSYSISPGTSATYTMRFAPTRGGAQSCTVSLSNICSLIGATGTGDVSTCFVSPLTLDFGTVRLDDYQTQSFLVRNEGSAQLSGAVRLPAGDNLCGSFWLPTADSTYDLAPGASKSFLVAVRPRVIASSVSCAIELSSSACAPVTCLANVVAPEYGSCGGWSVTSSPIDFGTVPIGQSASRTLHISAPADCVYSGASVDVLVYGPDFTFADGTASKHVTLDLAVNWTFDVRFTPTVEGEESFALVTYRACGGPGYPCQGIAGSGIGARTGASLVRRWPAPWRPAGVRRSSAR